MLYLCVECKTKLYQARKLSSHACMCGRGTAGIHFESFYCFSIGFCFCSDSVVFLYSILLLFRQCAICFSFCYAFSVAISKNNQTAIKPYFIIVLYLVL